MSSNPTLLHAERYESGALSNFGATAVSAHPELATFTLAHDALSIVFTMFTYTGYAMILSALMLPAEVPGADVADIGAHQMWWFARVTTTAVTLWLIAFARVSLVWGVAVILLAAPLVIGAPKPDAFAGTTPPERAAKLAARALGMGLASWSVLGCFATYFLDTSKGGKPKGTSIRILIIFVIGLFFGAGGGVVFAVSGGTISGGHEHSSTKQHAHMAHATIGYDTIEHATPHYEPSDIDAAIAPTLEIKVTENPMVGYNLYVLVKEFTFAPQSTSLAHVAGEGHAYVYANGVKLSRLCSEWTYPDALPKGEVEIEVFLNPNDHRALALDGVPITAEAMNMVN